MWEVSEEHLESISIGAGILGTGGGGNPYLGQLRARRQLQAGASVSIIEPSEVDDAHLLVAVGGMGSPVISHEKLPGGDEEASAVRALEAHLGQSFDAIAPIEMGGGNAMTPLVVATQLGIPVVDGDGMGRAFPELQMTTYLIYGGSPEPAALADERGNTVVLSHVTDAGWLERIARAVTIEMGGHAGLATTVMTGAQCKATIIPGTLRLALRIGDAVLSARRAKDRHPSDAVLGVVGGTRYLRGKVVDVERRATRGFAKGTTTIEGLDEDAGRRISVEFQNENLVVVEDGAVTVTVPDLIALVDTERGGAITTEVVRYGLRTDVLVLPCPPQLRTELALTVVGPRAFGFDLDYARYPGRAPRVGAASSQ